MWFCLVITMVFLKRYEEGAEVGEGTSACAYFRNSGMPLHVTRSPPCNDRHECGECQSPLCFLPNIPGGVGVGHVLELQKEKHIFPYSHVSHGEMNRQRMSSASTPPSTPHTPPLTPSPSHTHSPAHFLYLLREMICLTGEFWRTCWQGWACPFWDFLSSQPGHVIFLFFMMW